MKPSTIASVTVGLILAALNLPAGLAAAQQASPERIVINVHAGQPGNRVSPSLYGIFFEEINHAGDGGLYAEMIRNRDFEEQQDGASIPSWTLKNGEAGARLSLDTSRPLTTANPHALRLDIPSTAQVTAISNGGYWGVPVEKGASYKVSFYARCDNGFTGPVSVKLETSGGTELASARITGIGGEWKRYTATLRAGASDPMGRFTLSTPAHGSLWLDVVSLFPTKTYKGRRNGLRADLAARLADMHPAFARFPGGCYVEGGDHLADAFRWARTIGEVPNRPGHMNATWNYRSTDGLGYHEFLQLCEDIGAEPLYVVNCGMAHKEFVPAGDLEPWIQEALGAIEYANGPATSKWGVERAKNGHPEPFNLRYIEIGNENGLFGPAFGGSVSMYTPRYQRFFDSIKAKYPAIRTIADTRVPAPMEVVDDHYYNGPDWFWTNIHLYDRTDRSGPKVYVGEYAVTSNCGLGNLKAALAEAAFMTGFERNCDVVQMSSYAPLFVNANDRKWNPDAIVFDGAASYGTPSYWVQKLFSENRPDTNLTVDAPELVAKGTGKGTIGLGTWRTESEYKDVEVTCGGRVVYSSDFSRSADHWKPVRGDWSVVDGAYRQSALDENRRSLLDNAELAEASDYTLHLKARKLRGAEGFLVMFRTRGDGDWYWWNIGGWNNTEHSIEKQVNGGGVPFGPHVRGSIETGRWYDVRIVAEGDRIRCYLDGKLIHDVADRGAPTLAAVAGRSDASGDLIVKIVSRADHARDVTLSLEQAGLLASSGKMTVLTAESLEAENSFSNPNRIVPRTTRISGVSSRFNVSVAPRSLTILRLHPVRRDEAGSPESHGTENSDHEPD